MSGKNNILLPLIETPDEVKCTTMRIHMVNGKKFEKEVKNSLLELQEGRVNF